MHYNGFPAAEINGGPAPGVSSGEAQDAITSVLNTHLPRSMSFEWTELAYQQVVSGNTMLLVFPLCVLLVYVVLAAQYESWTMPLSVILIVPMTLLSALAGVWLTGGDNNVFTQISFLVLAALACKNAILIVEFARQREHEGEDRVTAILDACRVRLRPVLMTSMAAALGMLPLAYGIGSGADMLRPLAISVIGALCISVALSLVATPTVYYLMYRLTHRASQRVPVRAEEVGVG
jgi:multidrug efflux pump